jgi:hypothetical protein
MFNSILIAVAFSHSSSPTAIAFDQNCSRELLDDNLSLNTLIYQLSKYLISGIASFSRRRCRLIILYPQSKPHELLSGN